LILNHSRAVALPNHISHAVAAPAPSSHFCEACLHMIDLARRTFPLLLSLLTVIVVHPGPARAADKPGPEPDVLVLANGDTLHGQLVKVVTGTVTFHT
jgi:hypothetical protein